MGCAVVGAAKRHHELIAGLATKRARLHEAQVIGAMSWFLVGRASRAQDWSAPSPAKQKPGSSELHRSPLALHLTACARRTGKAAR
jgi:hypothetical protein